MGEVRSVLPEETIKRLWRLTLEGEQGPRSSMHRVLMGNTARDLSYSPYSKVSLVLYTFSIDDVADVWAVQGRRLPA